MPDTMVQQQYYYRATAPFGLRSRRVDETLGIRVRCILYTIFLYRTSSGVEEG